MSFIEITVKKSEYYDEISKKSEIPRLYYIKNEVSLIDFDKNQSSLVCSEEVMEILRQFDCDSMVIEGEI